jgi:N-acetylmuramoyl-L-alanine amidase
MRSILCCLVLYAAATCHLVSAATKLKTITLFGANYVDLREWAELKGFDLTTNKKEMTAEMTNRWAKVTFFIDSKRATVNDVSVWLSHATASTRGSIYVADRDLTGVINPLLFPVKAPPSEKIRKIALSAGHGGKDPGNQWGMHKEKEYTLLLSKEVGEILENAGLEVVQVRKSDAYVEPEDHAKIANQKHADLFVSLHFNSVPFASSNSSPRGVQSYCLTPVGETPTNGGTLPSHSSPGNRFDRRSILLAYEIQKAMIHTLDTPDLGVRRAGFMVLRKAEMPGVLVEGGFMSNPEEAKMIYDLKYRREMARAIADGVLAYKRLVEH